MNSQTKPPDYDLYSIAFFYSFAQGFIVLSVGMLAILAAWCMDLSPVMDGHWGDCARSFYIENGRTVEAPVSLELAEGKAFLADLHHRMQAKVRPDWTFDTLFKWANAEISAAGFENLDFLGNVGHSIATSRADRQFIEANNSHLLSNVPFFTFEPHVRRVGGLWGFKHENIFYFDAVGAVAEL